MVDQQPKSEKKTIVIIGGGIIGVSAAYYLSRHRLYESDILTITVLEANSIAGGSSGKGGGFIAEWATPKCLAPLSFKLHNDLAIEHDGDQIWGHRNVYAAEIKLLGQRLDANNGSNPTNKGDPPSQLDWLLPGSIQHYDEIGVPSNSGQVNPYLFTRTLTKLAESKGVIFKLGASATKINVTENGKSARSVEFKDGDGTHSLEATDIVVAAGPWTPKLLPSVSLLTPRGHSVIVKPTRPLSPYILFPDISPAPGSGIRELLSPDIYPRPPDTLYAFDTVYASGPDDYEANLPSGTHDVELVERKCADVLKAVGSVSREIHDGSLVKKQACYKPQIRKHEEGEEVGPMVGSVGIEGLWLATGHDEWGIQNGPGTGLVLTEMILDGEASSADCRGLDPKLFLDGDAEF